MLNWSQAMTLHPQSYDVPEETARVARTIFPKGDNLYMAWQDHLGLLFADEDFIDLYPQNGQSVLSPARLTVVSMLQFAENLSDRQTADAVRTRIDWKYLLCLELDDPGFHYSVLSEFRDRVRTGNMEARLFDKLLASFRDHRLLKSRGKQRTDSTHVLAAIRQLNWLELVGETMRHALNTLAVVLPEWTLTHTDPTWSERYGKRVSDYYLPKSEPERTAYAEVVGQDGLALLNAIGLSETPPWVRQVPAILTLHRVWIQNYTWTPTGTLRWRTKNERPPASLAVQSPYDPEAHFSKKQTTKWVGYKVHITETCDKDYPRLITHIETSSAPVHDTTLIPIIHQALADKISLPEVHLVDSGYMNAGHLVQSQQQYDIDLLGPTHSDTAWQSKDEASFTAKDFISDWDNQWATCPEGKRSLHWRPVRDNKGKNVIQIKFSKHDCRLCPSQTRCTRSTPPRRSVTVQPQAQQQALQYAREREKTDTFKQTYAQRAGIEGTISFEVRRSGLRHSRYLGQSKLHWQHVFTALSTNLIRVIHWLQGDRPEQTRQSAFVQLHSSISASA